MTFDKQSQIGNKIKNKTCKVCKNKFEPTFIEHIVCSVECALKYAPEQKAKEDRKAEKSKKLEWNKAKREHKANDRSYQLKKTQDIFNKWIRLRDGNICITCGNTDRQIHAGHYMPVGRHSEIRFDANNCHSQCVICNNHKSGNLAVYRQKMIEKYGVKEVERLEHSTTKKWTIEELKELQNKYKMI